MNKYYITNAIPYVNAVPHIGHALEFIQSDTIARYHKLLGKDVMYVCGSDENALKNAQVAETEDIPVQELVDKYASAFSDVARKLNVEFDIFQKTSDQEKHYPASQKLWELCAKNGDIYKKSYKGLYCVGCEEFKSSEDLNEHGECPEHPGKKLQEVEEENYFFKLSKYQDQLNTRSYLNFEKMKLFPLLNQDCRILVFQGVMNERRIGVFQFQAIRRNEFMFGLMH
jgi:methionyl-tRNA synthetase